ncbi:helix-turn-helix transcriptional regulator [Hamadaea sp. NPDC050747]|uniref:helix-turn-helix domain-containing protein n=1 Tax=Hamadaea sp. NPDC050747 TaxID=3155789 RepID=UPI0033C13D8E
MPVPTEAVGRIERRCAAGGDLAELRRDLVEELRRSVGFEFYAFLMTDPRSAVGAAPMAEIPSVPDLPRLIRLKYLTPVNRWTALTTPVGLLRQGGDPARSLVWREWMAPFGIADVASVVFRDRYGCWGFLDLWRTGKAFTAAEAGFLARLAGPMTTAMRSGLAETFRQRPPVAERTGPIVLMLSAELDLLGQTPQTSALLRTLVPPSPGRAVIPAGAYNVAAQLLANEAEVDTHPPYARVHLSEGEWLTLRADRLGDDIAVSIERSSPAERLDLFSRAFGLSAREAELLRRLAAGADTREVAQLLFLSEHTVQDHLKSIFAKTGLRTRPSLLSHALGS